MLSGWKRAKAGSGKSGSGKGKKAFPPSTWAPTRVILLGLGLGDEDPADMSTADSGRHLAGRAIKLAAESAKKAGAMAIALPKPRAESAPPSPRRIAEGAVLGSYRFDGYKGQARRTVRVASARSPSSSSDGVTRRTPGRGEPRRHPGANRPEPTARDLSNEPANVAAARSARQRSALESRARPACAAR